MSDKLPEKKEKQAPAKPKRPKKSASKWFREFRAEFKKIVWPGWKQIKNNTAVVLAMLIIMASVIALFDFGVRSLLGLFIDTYSPYYGTGYDNVAEGESDTGGNGAVEEGPESGDNTAG